MSGFQSPGFISLHFTPEGFVLDAPAVQDFVSDWLMRPLFEQSPTLREFLKLYAERQDTHHAAGTGYADPGRNERFDPSEIRQSTASAAQDPFASLLGFSGPAADIFGGKQGAISDWLMGPLFQLSPTTREENQLSAELAETKHQAATNFWGHQNANEIFGKTGPITGFLEGHLFELGPSASEQRQLSTELAQTRRQATEDWSSPSDIWKDVFGS